MFEARQVVLDLAFFGASKGVEMKFSKVKLIYERLELLPESIGD